MGDAFNEICATCGASMNIILDEIVITMLV